MLSDATIDAANRAITQVFETTSMAWRTIPHWHTGDPGRGYIRNDSWYQFSSFTAPPAPLPPTLNTPTPGLGAGPYGGAPIQINGDATKEVNVTLAEAISTNADQVVSAASAMAVEVVKKFDQDVAAKLADPALNLVNAGTYAPPTPVSYHASVPISVFGPPPPPAPPAPVVPTVELLGARSTIENAGYRGTRSVWAGAGYFNAFHQALGSRLILPACTSSLQMSSIYRWEQPPAPDDTLDALDPDDPTVKKPTSIESTMIIIGRRQEIAPGRAFEAAAAPEPIDLAVSVAPSLEIIGDNSPNREINLAVRIRYALRFKDNRAVVVWRTNS